MKTIPVTRGKVYALLGRAVWIELIRRQDLYICLMLMGLFVLGMLVVRIVGVDAPATGTFMLNLGLTLASASAHIVTMLLAARQIPDEIEHRTLYPLLARPVRRIDVILGKWLPSGLCGIALYAVLLAVAWLSVPKLESYVWATFGQMIVLQILSLFFLGALGLSLTLVLPKAAALVVTGGLYFGGATLRRLLVSGMQVPQWVAAYVPDFSLLDLTTRYTDGIGPLAPVGWWSAVVYGVLFTAFWIGLGMVRFERRQL